MYKRDSQRWIKHLDFILLDMICLQIAYVLSYKIAGIGIHPYDSLLYRNMAFILEVADLLVIYFFQTMKNVLKIGKYKTFVRTVKHCFFVGCIAIIYLYLCRQGQDFSRLTMGLTFVIYCLLTYVIRELWKLFLLNKVLLKPDKSLLIVTTSDIANDVIQNVKQNSVSRYIINAISMIDQDMIGEKIDDIPVLCNYESTPEYVCREWVDEVLIVTSTNYPSPFELIDKLTETGITIHINLGNLTNVPGKKQFVEKVGNYTVLTTSINTVSSYQLFMKRLIDICAGLAGCILTGIIYLFIAPKIKKESPGPVFYSQPRVGKNGKIFKMYKFRSMYLDADERKAELMKQNKMEDAFMFKMDFDPRVIGNKILSDGTHQTGIGDFIRRTSLDEFPQFFNVLKGDMSLIGTRPPLIEEAELYELRHRSRLAIKPGITGLWQVSGRSEITDFDEVVKLDREYIMNWDIGMDIKIFLKTIKAVLSKKGSM